MFLVVEKMGAAAVDEEEDEVALVFWRLAGGEVAARSCPLLFLFLCWSTFFERGGLVVVLDFRTHFLPIVLF